MIREEPGSGSRAGSGSIPLTSRSGSESWRPKNAWIRWIRIRNTGYNSGKVEDSDPQPYYSGKLDPDQIKLQFPEASIKDVQAREDFDPQKRTFSSSKLEI
jgi:hypothetical protein